MGNSGKSSFEGIALAVSFPEKFRDRARPMEREREKQKKMMEGSGVSHGQGWRSVVSNGGEEQ